jgi:hypothetical protein
MIYADARVFSRIAKSKGFDLPERMRQFNERMIEMPRRTPPNLGKRQEAKLPYRGLPCARETLDPEVCRAFKRLLDQEATGPGMEIVAEAVSELLDYARRYIRDPRDYGSVKYDIHEMLALGALADISGAESAKDIKAFGEAKLSWLRRFLPLKEGVPSVVGLKGIYANLDAFKAIEEFQIFFTKKSGAFAKALELEPCGEMAGQAQEFPQSQDKASAHGPQA